MYKLTSIWLVFYVLEGILALTATGIHISGMLIDREPLPHIMFFCGTYCTLSLMSLIGVIKIYLRTHSSALTEVLAGATGIILCLIAAILSMYYAENDFHLMYLSGNEEATHPFFMKSKAQSITSLLGSVTYLLHFIFAVDVMVITEENNQYVRNMHKSVESFENNYPAVKHLKTNLTCWLYLLRFEICQTCVTTLYDFDEDDKNNKEHTKRLTIEHGLSENITFEKL